MPLPEVAVSVPPVQVVEALGVAATTIPAGRLSVTSRELAPMIAALLSTVRVIVVAKPAAIVGSAKSLEKVGAGTTTSVSDAADAVGTPLTNSWLVVLE